MEAVAAKAAGGVSCAQRGGRSEGARTLEARGDRERQRLRRADEDRSRVLAREPPLHKETVKRGSDPWPTNRRNRSGTSVHRSRAFWIKWRRRRQQKSLSSWAA